MDDENSRKSHQHSDGNKPFKKARYIWEVKGKHHLRTTNLDDPSDEAASTSTRRDIEQSQGANCCLNTFLLKTDEKMDNDNLDEGESDSNENYYGKIGANEEDPVTLVLASPENEDYHLERWQARQLARGLVDNTINSILEQMTERPTFDVASLIDDCVNDGRVEDDAILMAIQSHGLQPTVRIEQTQGDHLGPNNDSINVSLTANSDFTRKTETSISDIENIHQNQQEINQFDTMASTSNCISMYHCNEKDDFNDPVNNFIIHAAVTVAIQKKGLTYA